MNIQAVMKTGFLKFINEGQIEAGLVLVDGQKSITLQFEENFKTANEAHIFLQKRADMLGDALDGFRIVEAPHVS